MLTGQLAPVCLVVVLAHDSTLVHDEELVARLQLALAVHAAEALDVVVEVGRATNHLLRLERKSTDCAAHTAHSGNKNTLVHAHMWVQNFSRKYHILHGRSCN